MSGVYPIMRSLDPHHQRVGYLGALAGVAERGLDTKDALRARLEKVLFRRLTVDSPELQEALLNVPPGRRAALDSIRSKRSQDDSPASILRDLDEGTDWLYSSELWLHQKCSPSSLGFVSRDRVDRIIDLARWTGILTPMMELSESGFLIQLLLTESKSKGRHGSLFNVLDPSPRRGLSILYLRLLLGAEMLWPALLSEMVARDEAGRDLASKGERGLLRASVERLLADLGEPQDPSHILDLREIAEFKAAILNNRSTEENYLRPRLELMLDLGLIKAHSQRGGRRRDSFPWAVTPRTKRLAREWCSLSQGGNGIPEYLEEEFFASMGRVYSIQVAPVTDPRVVLHWLADAFSRAGREIGFTPGRTLATLACLLSFEAGQTMEIRQVFDAVYSAAKSKWGEYLHFSGGSRFDREFLLKIRPGLKEVLGAEIGAGRSL